MLKTHLDSSNVEELANGRSFKEPNDTPFAVSRKRGGRTILTKPIFLFALIVTRMAFAAEQAQLHVGQGQRVVQSAAFSPNGKLIVMSSNSPLVLLWDAENGRQIRRYGPLPNGVSVVAFSPDGEVLMTGGSDGEVRLWNTASGYEVAHFKAHDDVISSVAFSPDGRRILTGSYDETTRLWDLRTKREVQRFVGHSGEVYSAAFSPNGRSVLTGSRRGAQLFDVESGSEIAKFDAGRVFTVAFSADGRRISTGSEDHVRIWAASNGHQVRAIRTDRWVVSVEFSRDGTSLVSGDIQNSAVWDIVGGRQLASFPAGGPALFSPDGKSVLVCGALRTQLFDLKTRALIRRFESQTNNSDVMSVAFSPNGHFISVATLGRTVLWDLENGSEVHNLWTNFGWTFSASFSPDGHAVLTGGQDGIARLWDASTGIQTGSFIPPGVDLSVIGADQITKVMFSEDGRSILVSSFDGARLWDLEHRTEIRRFSDSAHITLTAALSPDGHHVLTASNLSGSDPDGNTMQLWNTDTGQMEARFKGHSGQISSAVFSPNGRLVLSGSADNTARLWDAATGQQIRSFVGHTGEIRSVAFSADGRSVLTGSMDDTARLWDTESGREIGRFIGHLGGVVSAAFSPDGKLVVTGGIDGTARLWRLPESSFRCEQTQGSSWASCPLQATLVSFVSDDFSQTAWASVDPYGRYDASNPDELPGVYWLIPPYRTISLAQLRRSFYQPGLLGRIFQQVSLPPIEGLSNIRHLPPVVIAAVSDERTGPSLQVTLIGVDKAGHGRLTIRVNGRPFPARLISQTGTDNSESLQFSMDEARFAAGENKIEVTVASSNNLIESDPATATWPRGFIPELAAKSDQPTHCKGRFYGIFVGVGNFRFESDLDLKYPAKDAQALADAMSLGARALCGRDNVEFHVLTTDNQDPSSQPTKENIKRAFQTIAAKSTRNDLLFVYLSGHGATSTGMHSYFYLTQDARQVNVDIPDKLRSLTTLSAHELVAWLRSPSLPDKQVLVLDTCAAGAAAVQLAKIGTTQRSLENDLKKAVDNWNLDTGTYILMGSASDKSSYESDRVRHGLLTYALLRGIKGDALLDGNRLEAAHWFEVAIAAAENYASRINLEQKPIEAIPTAAGGIPLGYFESAIRDQIVVPDLAPQILKLTACYLRETSRDAGLHDPLNLKDMIRSELRALTNRMSAEVNRQIGYNDNDSEGSADDLTPQVLYQKDGSQLRVTMTIVQIGRPDVSKIIDMSADNVPAVAKQIALEIVELASQK